MRIALAGNPNSGKTTLYNALTGKTEQVGNWSGVTVDKKAAKLKGKYTSKDREIHVVDLPGAYSISPYTSEESITRDFVMDENPDVIINIVDGANLSRSLFFTTQLIELGLPMVIALNKDDVLNRRGDQIDIKKLESTLGCPVIRTVAHRNQGLNELIDKAVELVDKGETPKALSLAKSCTDLERQNYVDEVVKSAMKRTKDLSKVTFSDKVDRIVAHQYLGLPIFFLVMWGVYWFSIEGLGGYLSGYFNDTLFGEIVPNALNGLFETVEVNPLLQGLIVDGAVAGVGAVIGFLPLIMVLFFCLSLLEDSGYMSRVAVIMDRYFKRIGLSGKSIIPMIVGSGCAIPGVMATRTIEDENEKKITTLLTPFVPCGAKLPIIALFSAAFFPNASWVGPSMYILAIVVIILGGLFLKNAFKWEATSTFIMELPEYKVPSLKYALTQMLQKAKGFIYKATTIILVMNTLVWFMQEFSWALQPVEDQSMSILASVGGWIAPILLPLGFVGWQLGAASVTGFVAKENVVATFGILLAASEDMLHMSGGPMAELFNPVTAYAFLVFNLFTPPCFAAIGAMRSELGSGKWLARGLAFQFSVGYLLAILFSHVGSLVIYGKVATGFVPAMIILAAYAVLITYLIKRPKQATVASNMK
ncbi:ferrous iron transport protein B [Fusibacter sp. JL298sf-3]